MSKPKAPNIPPAPGFQPDPNVAFSQNTFRTEIPKLLSLSGLPENLAETIQLNPDIARLATQQYTAAQEPAYRTGRQNIINQLEANNQLTGSTTGSSLQNYENDYLSGLTSANAGLQLENINRALENRVRLYGLGLNTNQVLGSQALENQGQTNNFALQNYENQVAAALAAQPPKRGGFFGALTGAVGGGLGGFAVGGPIGAAVGAGLGGLAGGLGSPGTGGQFLGAGAYSSGNRGGLSSPGIVREESISTPIYATSPNWLGISPWNKPSSGFGV